MRHLRGGLIGIVLFSSAPAVCETVTPSEARYDFESQSGKSAKSCAITLVLVDPPKKEYIDFRIFSVAEKGKVASLQYLFYVGDVISKDGKPGKKQANLHAGYFHSKEFTAGGRALTDGGVLSDSMTATGDIYLEFIKAVKAGQFELTFQRENQSAVRTYFVSGGPPGPVTTKFAQCFGASVR